MEQQKIIGLFSSITRKLLRQVKLVAEAEGFSTTEALVLWKMSRNHECRVTELAEEIGVPPSTFTGVLDRLVEGKWLERLPDPEDRRATLLKATPEGVAAIERLTSISRRKLSAMFGSIPRKRMERMAGDLQALLDCLEEEGGSR